jgi:hypothetical protein
MLVKICNRYEKETIWTRSNLVATGKKLNK